MAAITKHEIKETCKEMVLAHPQECKQLDFAAMEDGVFFIGFINRNILMELTARGQAYPMFGDERDPNSYYCGKTKSKPDDFKEADEFKRRFMFEAAKEKEVEDGEIYMDLVGGAVMPQPRFRFTFDRNPYQRINTEFCMELIGGVKMEPRFKRHI